MQSSSNLQNNVMLFMHNSMFRASAAFYFVYVMLNVDKIYII